MSAKPPEPGRRPRPKPNVRECLRIKIISMGEAGVGKSCLIKRYCEEKFVPKYISTIGVDYGVKSIVMNEKETKINFFDLSGVQDFFEVRNEFYRDTQGALLVYDVTSGRSLEALDSWMKEASYFGARDMVTVVCANKADLIGDRVISEADGQIWARQRNLRVFETSAKTGQNVGEAFMTLFGGVVANLPRAP
eukprot:TRINITY_DN5092_c0_g1_i1.p1 TRINITY_DN5092_c0_g1~~TRINITY_DN5092_c0_g1_i1.p1  ORF type:complete len:193 (-),score=13.59 TRINITY_DN5092_c0_g1_i1:124-702(-)